MLIRNRNAISAIRKKYERIEQFKKDKKLGIPFTQFAEARALFIELSLEIEQIGREINELNDQELGVNRYEIAIEHEITQLSNCEVTSLDNVFTIKKAFPSIYIRHNGEDVYIGNFTLDMTIHKSRAGRFDIKLINDNRKSKRSNGLADYDHPHVQSSSPCFGSYYNLIYAQLRNGSVREIFPIIDEFLRSYNEQSIFISIDYWKNRYLECGCLNNCSCEVEDENGLSEAAE